MKRLKTSTIAPRQRRHARVRARVIGSASCPRLSVFRGNKGMIAQLIDDAAGKTLCYVSSKTVKPAAVEGKKAKVAIGFLMGQQLAEMAKAKKISRVVFDRGGYAYHGRVAAVADGARSGGLVF